MAGETIVEGRHGDVVVERRGEFGRIVRLLIAAAIVALVVVVGFDNRAKVRIGYPGGHRNAPIWVVLVAAGIAGVIIGWLVKHRPRHIRT